MNFSIVLLIQNNWLKAFFSSNKKFLIKKIILIVILLVILASLDYYLMKWYENFYDKAISLKDYEVFKFLIFQFINYLNI